MCRGPDTYVSSQFHLWPCCYPSLASRSNLASTSHCWKKSWNKKKALASSTCYYGNGFIPLEVRHQLEINEFLLSKLNYMGQHFNYFFSIQTRKLDFKKCRWTNIVQLQGVLTCVFDFEEINWSKIDSFAIHLLHSAVKLYQEDTNSCYERGSQWAPAVWRHKTGWHHSLQKTAATAGIWIPAAKWLHTCHFKEPSCHKNGSHHLVVASGAEEKLNKVGRLFSTSFWKGFLFHSRLWMWGNWRKQCNATFWDVNIYLSIYLSIWGLNCESFMDCV